MEVCIFIDDELDVLALYQTFLKSGIKGKEIDFHFFSRGDECLKFLQSSPKFEKCLLFLDINMPVMNGLELLKSVKEEYTDYTCYMLSAYSDESYVSKAKEIGAELYLTKPVDIREVKKHIADYFSI